MRNFFRPPNSAPGLRLWAFPRPHGSTRPPPCGCERWMAPFVVWGHPCTIVWLNLSFRVRKVIVLAVSKEWCVCGRPQGREYGPCGQWKRGQKRFSCGRHKWITPIYAVHAQLFHPADVGLFSANHGSSAEGKGFVHLQTTLGCKGHCWWPQTSFFVSLVHCVI